MSYEMIKRNYERGMWTKAHVLLAVRKGVITSEQAEEIINAEH